MNLKRTLTGITLAAEMAGCGTISPSQLYVSSGTPPAYRQIVLRDLHASLDKNSTKKTLNDDARTPEEVVRGTFVNAARLGRVEISGVSQTLHKTLGMVWFACLRSYPAGAGPSDYAIFMNAARILDARRSLLIDDCGSKQYTLLTVVPPFQGRMPIY